MIEAEPDRRSHSNNHQESRIGQVGADTHFAIMSQHDLNEVTAASITGRAELLFAIANLVDEVAQLASNVDRIVAIADARRKQSEPRRRPTLSRRARRKTAEQAPRPPDQNT
jgi:hypothetical protein